MKKILFIALSLISITAFAQNDIIRTGPVGNVSSNTATFNKQSVVDANLKAKFNLSIPRASSFTLNNAKDTAGYIMYNTSIGKMGIYKGPGLGWDTLAVGSVNLSAYYTKTQSDARFVSLTGSYVNPTWITSLAWSKITSTPTTLAGYGITDAVPSSRTLTINGTAFDLSANRTWTVAANTTNSLTPGYGLSGTAFNGSAALVWVADTTSATGLVSKSRLASFTYTKAQADARFAPIGITGTVTNVSALTLGTTGTDLTSSVANSTTTPVITLNVPTASASNRGALSSTDWTNFNNKFSLPSLTNGSVLFSNGTTISQDNSKFFYDYTNHRLGIGTVTPSFALDVVTEDSDNVMSWRTNSETGYAAARLNRPGGSTAEYEVGAFGAQGTGGIFGAGRKVFIESTNVNGTNQIVPDVIVANTNYNGVTYPHIIRLVIYGKDKSTAILDSLGNKGFSVDSVSRLTLLTAKSSTRQFNINNTTGTQFSHFGNLSGSTFLSNNWYFDGAAQYDDNTKQSTSIVLGTAGDIAFNTAIANTVPSTKMSLSNAGNLSVTGTITLADEAYSSSWNGKLEAPTKNAIWDAGFLTSSGAVTSIAGTASQITASASTGAVTLSLPSTINVNTSGNAATVTTNANLTGVITSSGNATSIASQTGTGTKFVVDNTPTLITPIIGAATGTSLTLSGLAQSASLKITGLASASSPVLYSNSDGTISASTSLAAGIQSSDLTGGTATSAVANAKFVDTYFLKLTGGTLSGALTTAALTTSGLITANASISFGTNSVLTPGYITHHATTGLTTIAKTGSAFDWSVYDASGNAAMHMATGTKNITFDGNTSFLGTVKLAGYTVSTLPAGSVGMTAYVTDALAPTFLVAVVGGGAVVTPVFYNGSSWVAH